MAQRVTLLFPGRGNLPNKYNYFEHTKLLIKLTVDFLNTMMPEYMLPFLIYLLANDPDFLEGISKRSLARIKE